METNEQDTSTDDQDETPEFDPEEVENDPSRNPDEEHLKDLKGG
jgi:hypothetical protein